MGEINNLLPKCEQVNLLFPVGAGYPRPSSIAGGDTPPLPMQPYLGQTFSAETIRELFAKYQTDKLASPHWCIMGEWNQAFYLSLDQTTYTWLQEQGQATNTLGLASLPVGRGDHSPTKLNNAEQYGFYQVPGTNNTYKNYLLSETEYKLKQQTLSDPGKLIESIFSDDPLSYLALSQFLQLANQQQELHQLPTQLYRSKPFYHDALGLKTDQPVAGGSGPYYHLYVVVENYHAHQCEQKPDPEKFLELAGLNPTQIADLVRVGNFLPEQTCSYADRFYLPKDVYKLKIIHDYLNGFIEARNLTKRPLWFDLAQVKNITAQIAAILPDEGPASLGTGRWMLEKLFEWGFLTITFGPSIGFLMHWLQNRLNPAGHFGERLFPSSHKWIEYYLQAEQAKAASEKSPIDSVRKIINDLDQSNIKNQKGNFVYSETFPKKVVYELAKLLRIQENKIPNLIMAAADIKVQSELATLTEKQLNLNKLMDWLQTDAGINWLKENRAQLKDTLGKRFLENGPSLMIGIVSMLGAEQIADILGLDPYQHAQERFLFILASAYTGQHLTQGLTEITLNTLRKQPYVLARPQMLNGDFIYKFTGSRSWGQWLTQGSKSFFKNIPESLSNMGVGLLTSMLADQTLGRHLATTPRQRDLIRLGGFFFPEVYKMAWGNRRWHIFENKYIKGVGLLAMTATVGDMIYGWLRKDEDNKVELAYEMSVKQRAYPGFKENVVAQLMPNLAFAQGVDLQDAACQKTISDDREMSQQVLQAVQAYSLAQLIHLPFTEITPEAFDKIDLAHVFNKDVLYPADQRMLEYLAGAATAPLRERDIREQLLNHFPYERISKTRFENLMAALQKQNLRNAIKSLQWINLPEADFARNYFDIDGKMKSGMETEWLNNVVGAGYPRPSIAGAATVPLQTARKLALALQMLEHPELRKHPNLIKLAQHAGLMNDKNEWMETDLFKQALVSYQQMHPDLTKDLVAQLKIQIKDADEQKLYDVIIAQL